jgi:protein tyrosine phosphatase
VDVAKILCSENKIAFENVSLSRRTTVRRVEEMNSDLLSQLRIQLRSSRWMTVLKQVTQVCYIYIGVNKFDVITEVLSIAHNDW